MNARPSIPAVPSPENTNPLGEPFPNMRLEEFWRRAAAVREERGDRVTAVFFRNLAFRAREGRAAFRREMEANRE